MNVTAPSAYTAPGCFQPWGNLSHIWRLEGTRHICYVEEFAAFPVCSEDLELDHREVIAHLGVLAARYTDVDLSKTRSMWSLLDDLAPLDVDVDEKQENANSLVEALSRAGFIELAKSAAAYNDALREVIRKDYRLLPRGVYQGDLNFSNALLKKPL